MVLGAPGQRREPESPGLLSPLLGKRLATLGSGPWGREHDSVLSSRPQPPHKSGKLGPPHFALTVRGQFPWLAQMPDKLERLANPALPCLPLPLCLSQGYFDSEGTPEAPVCVCGCLNTPFPPAPLGWH